MAIKTKNGKVVLKNGKPSCECCDPETGCISGDSGFPLLPIPPEVGPCIDFLTATTTTAKSDGLYQCTGYADDQANITWPGGSLFFPAPEGGCVGTNNLSFNVSLTKGDTVSCTAGSWGGIVGCRINCCPVTTI